jgi:hypothetical protein
MALSDTLVESERKILQYRNRQMYAGLKPRIDYILCEIIKMRLELDAAYEGPVIGPFYGAVCAGDIDQYLALGREYDATGHVAFWRKYMTDEERARLRAQREV